LSKYSFPLPAHSFFLCGIRKNNCQTGSFGRLRYDICQENEVRANLSCPVRTQSLVVEYAVVTHTVIQHAVAQICLTVYGALQFDACHEMCFMCILFSAFVGSHTDCNNTHCTSNIKFVISGVLIATPLRSRPSRTLRSDDSQTAAKVSKFQCHKIEGRTVP
jgi:hypothetical protein